MTRLFGTDGIRGKAGEFPLDEKTCYWIGAALTMLLKKQSELPQVIIGHDTRESGSYIEEKISDGIKCFGGVVHTTGIIPTPGIAFLTKKFGFDAGIIVSASHNPYQDNGIKIFNSKGLKLAQKVEQEIEKIVLEQNKKESAPCTIIAGEEIKKNYLTFYTDFLLSLIDSSQSFSEYNIVLDCANGAVSEIGPMIFRQLGAEVDTVFCSPDGKNINKECGALHPWHMCNRVLESGADLGIAFDGDGDRAILADHKGTILDGDYTIMICAQYMKKMKKLSSRKIVATVMSNIGLEYALNKEKLNLVRAQVGDKYVLEKMMQEGANLGGEQSGHIIFSDILTAGDGIITAIEIMNIMKATKKRLAELAQNLIKYPQILLNVPVKEKIPLHELPKLSKTVEEIEKALDGSGRLLLRYSGTEPIARIMIEGLEQKIIETYAQKIAQVIKNEIGN
jgi:phosphoglucosamine mutase